MVRLTECIDTPLAPDEAWPRLADFAHTSEWDPGVAWATRLDDGPLGEDSRYRVGVVMGPGLTMPMAYRVIVMDAPRRVVLEGVGPTVRALDDIRVAPLEDGGSRVTWQADLGFRGPLGLLDGVSAPVFRRVGDKAMDGLAAWLGGTRVTG